MIIPSNQNYGPPTLRALLCIESADVRPSIVRIPFIFPPIAVDCSRHESNLRTPCYHPKFSHIEASKQPRTLVLCFDRTAGEYEKDFCLNALQRRALSDG